MFAMLAGDAAMTRSLCFRRLICSGSRARLALRPLTRLRDSRFGAARSLSFATTARALRSTVRDAECIEDVLLHAGFIRLGSSAIVGVALKSL